LFLLTQKSVDGKNLLPKDLKELMVMGGINTPAFRQNRRPNKKPVAGDPAKAVMEYAPDVRTDTRKGASPARLAMMDALNRL